MTKTAHAVIILSKLEYSASSASSFIDFIMVIGRGPCKILNLFLKSPMILSIRILVEAIGRVVSTSLAVRYFCPLVKLVIIN